MTAAPDISVRPPFRANKHYTKVVNLSEKVCSGQIGRFPVASIKGNKCVMITYDCTWKVVLAYPLKLKTAADHLEAVELLHMFVNSKGMHPKLHMIDN